MTAVMGVGVEAGPNAMEYPWTLNWMKMSYQVSGIELDSGASNISFAAAVTRGDIFDPVTGLFLNPLPADVTGFYVYFYTPAAQAAYRLSAGWTLAGQSMTARFTGTATMTVATSGTVTESSANQKRFTFNANPGNSWLYFTDMDPDDPVVLNTIEVFKTEYESRVDAGELFDPVRITDGTGWAFGRHLGTMDTNDNSYVEEFDDIATESFPCWYAGPMSSGWKSGTPISVIAKYHLATNTPVWLPIPQKASIDCVRAICQALIAILPSGFTVFLEYGNEHWNSQFSMWSYLRSVSDDVFNANEQHKQYGYRASQMFAAAREEFTGTGIEFRGVLGAAHALPETLTDIVTGIDTFLSRLAAGTEAPEFSAQVLTRTDLFKDYAITNYIGSVFPTYGVTAMTNDDPGVFTSGSHGLSNGAEMKIFTHASTLPSASELNDRYVVIANKTANTFELLDADTDDPIDTTSFGTFVNNTGCYLVPSAIFRDMDESEDLHNSNPAQYPTKYTYWNQRLERELYDGSTWGVVASPMIPDRVDAFETHKALADGLGLRLVAYEGGTHVVGQSPYLTSTSTASAQYLEYYLQYGRSIEAGYMHRWLYKLALESGFGLICKFVDGTPPSQFGQWGAQEWMGDTDNPVWRAIVDINQRKTGFRLRATA